MKLINVTLFPKETSIKDPINFSSLGVAHQRCEMVTTDREEDRSKAEGRANSESCSIATRRRQEEGDAQNQ